MSTRGRQITDIDRVMAEDSSSGTSWYSSKSSRHIQAVASNLGIKLKTQTVLAIVNHTNEKERHIDKIIKVTKL